MTDDALSRRDVLKVSVLGAAALALPIERTVRAKSISQIAESRIPRPYTVPFAQPPVLAPVRQDATTDYYEITQAATVAQILPGVDTPLFAYNGTVPGPTIKVDQGRRTVVRQINALPAQHPVLGYTPWTSTHLHGSASRPEYDGYAGDISHPGQWKDYHYPNWQNARTLWYHDHGVHHTSENVYMGLAAQYHLHDALETSLGIPQGEFDVPLILGDAKFGADGSLLFDDNLHAGRYGDVILVNGRPWPIMRVKRRKYRFRILNGCTSRGFMLKLSNSHPVQIIGTDGGLMPAPQTVTQWRHGMAERYEVVIDFARYTPGTRVELRNLGVKNSVDYDNTNKVMAFQVVADAFDPANNTVPAQLYPDNPVMTLTAAQSSRTRRLRVKKDGEIWEIGDQTWQEIVDSGYRKTFAKPDLDAVEIWEIENSSGGWFHPVHLHLVDFKILSRNGRAPRPEELGPKDTVYVGEGETVKVLVHFGPESGRYMIHCHNLPHEDHDMMSQFEVGDDGPDPILTAPPRSLATNPPPPL
ncbi:MAG: multicopper oxidase domain-containing protein [Pseudonocardiales bacterium]|jgi:spore coat protein A, manganese oxidase|nr:multicopper oxidase domain-containing protein [Pseudonocardiales bacterium]